MRRERQRGAIQEREGGPVALLPRWGTSNHRERRIPPELAGKLKDAYLDQRRSTPAQLQGPFDPFLKGL